jgi:putative transposase
MPPPAPSERDKHHRFPGEMISHGVWLSSRFPLSSREGQDLVCERGSDVTHAAIRPWWRKCGHDDANELRRRRAQPGNTWHLTEVFLPSHGQRHTLWRAVDQDANVLAILGQSRHNQQAVQQLCRTLRKGLPYVPRVIMMDKLKRYGTAQRESLPGVEHRQSRSRHTRCEHAHRPRCQRAHCRQGCTSPSHAQRLLAAYGPMAHHFRPRRHRLSASDSRQERSKRCESWGAMTGTKRVSPRLSSLPR